MNTRLNLDWKKLQDVLVQENILNRLVIVINLILLVLLASALTDITWRLMPGPDQAAPPLLPSGILAPEGTQEPDRDIKPVSRLGQAAGRWNIAQWQLFGAKPSVRQSTIAPVATSLPETKLNLVLRGVYASDNPQTAGAIISEPNGKQGFYRIEARLPGGAILKEVYADRIVLQRRGRLETLRLPEERIDAAKQGSQPVRTSGSGASRLPGMQTSREPSPREFRDIIVKDPQRLSDIVAMTPYSKGGRFIGYRLQPGKNKALFSQFGLQSGDIVTSINGITIDSPTNGLSVLRNLATASQVNIEVLRNGVSQNLVLNLNQ